jgi:hypothetical protein
MRARIRVTAIPLRLTASGVASRRCWSALPHHDAIPIAPLHDSRPVSTVPSGCRDSAHLDVARCNQMHPESRMIHQQPRGLDGQGRVLTRFFGFQSCKFQVPSTPQDPSGEILRGFV